MCHDGDILINIFSYQWHVAHWAGVGYGAGMMHRNNKLSVHLSGNVPE